MADRGPGLLDVNPARAGMILWPGENVFVVPCKPRASGDDPTTSVTVSANWK